MKKQLIKGGFLVLWGFIILKTAVYTVNKSVGYMLLAIFLLSVLCQISYNIVNNIIDIKTKHKYTLDTAERVEAFGKLFHYINSDKGEEHSGMCAMLARLFRINTINRDEWEYLSSYLYNNRPTNLYSIKYIIIHGIKPAFFFKERNLNIRRKWCRRHYVKHLRELSHPKESS